MTKEGVCPSCGKKILLRSDCYDTDGVVGNRLCSDCFAESRRKREEERAAAEREKRAALAEVEHKDFCDRLKEWRVISLEDIRPESEDVLYIWGNGFDLMHRVPSSYYHFRDSMGKNNAVRRMLEDYIAVDDVWADFEDALAHFDVDFMTSYGLLDGLLDTFDAYDEDGGAAEYYMSVEAAATPIATVAVGLPDRFGRWVDTLEVGTEDRPLKNLIRGGKVLDFNYTEFVETLYGIPRNNVCYVHGSRRERRSAPLILGHLPDSGGETVSPGKERNFLKGYRRALTEAARNSTMDYISECDASLTKDTQKIIKSREPFFSGLDSVSTIIAIGHSYSATDTAYYIRIKEALSGRKAEWIFGCYGVRDLDNLEQLLIRLELNKEDVTIFRTDTVVTTPLKRLPAVSTPRPLREKVLCRSADGRAVASMIKNRFIIRDEDETYEIETFSGVSRATFISDDSRVLVVTRGAIGVLMFEKATDGWRLSGEFMCDHQHLLVPRLRNVFLTDSDITFVYNNRVRKYSLADCSLIYNCPVKNAPSYPYSGTDIRSFLTIK